MSDVNRDLTSITCPVCKMTSYNAQDIEMGYCGNCKGYTGVVNPLATAKRIVDQQHIKTRDLVRKMREDSALGQITGDPTIPPPTQ